MTQGVAAQELAQPALGFSYACASGNFNDFNVEVASIVGGFNSDNVFVIEMSDGNGNFENGVVLGQVSDKNNTLNFAISFTLPNQTFGENHVIRVKSTSPVTTSPLSKIFSAYFISNTPLVLENYQDINLCEGTSTAITLEDTQFTSFNWYLDGAYYSTSGPTIDVKKPGLYYAEVDFGVCSGGVAISNLVRVSVIEALEPEILGEQTIALCAGDSYELVSNITSLDNNYYWYKEGNLITDLSLKSSSYTVSGDNIYGSYYLEIESSIGCVSQSTSVEITNANLDFDVTAVGEIENIIIFPGDDYALEIATTASITAINWYKDNKLFLQDGPKTITVTDEGNYKAMVSIPGDPCGAELSSPIFKVFNPSKYFISIDVTSNYNSCISSQATIEIVSLEYGISSGQKISFNDFDKAMFNYTWSYGGQPFGLENTATLSVNDVDNLDAYKLSIIDAKGVKAISNAVKVNLKLSEVHIEGDETVYLCANDSYTFKADIDNSKFRYTWFKNGVAIDGLPDYTPSYSVSEDVHADYRVEVRTNGGCTTVSNTVSLLSSAVSFNVIANDAAFPIVLYNDATKTLTISTTAVSPSITWFRDDYEIPGSNTLSLSISTSGEYRAKVEVMGECGQTVYSDYFSVITPENYEVSIKTDAAYTACSSAEVTLSLKELIIRVSADETMLVNPSDYDKFTFEWRYNDIAISGATETSLLVSDWQQSGSYSLKISAADNVTALSSNLEISLELPDVDISAENLGAVICKGTTVNLSTTEKIGCTYQWYMDGSPLVGQNSFKFQVLEEGSYFVAVIKNACESISESLEIEYIDEDNIVLSPSGIIFIVQGETKDVTVSGANSYEWQNEKGEILSTTDVLSVYEPGVYAVIAQIGNCEFVKTFEVLYNISTAVPNIISPNGDGVNDTWILPYGYSFNEEVEIIIYNANGIVVFKTTNYQNNWPDGNVVANTIYYYIIKDKGLVVKKGSITVIK